jgi:hypothetical protein
MVVELSQVCVRAEQLPFDGASAVAGGGGDLGIAQSASAEEVALDLSAETSPQRSRGSIANAPLLLGPHARGMEAGAWWVVAIPGCRGVPRPLGAPGARG